MHKPCCCCKVAGEMHEISKLGGNSFSCGLVDPVRCGFGRRGIVDGHARCWCAPEHGPRRGRGFASLAGALDSVRLVSSLGRKRQCHAGGHGSGVALAGRFGRLAGPCHLGVVVFRYVAFTGAGYRSELVALESATLLTRQPAPLFGLTDALHQQCEADNARTEGHVDRHPRPDTGQRRTARNPVTGYYGTVQTLV